MYVDQKNKKKISDCLANYCLSGSGGRSGTASIAETELHNYQKELQQQQQQALQYQQQQQQRPAVSAVEVAYR